MFKQRNFWVAVLLLAVIPCLVTNLLQNGLHPQIQTGKKNNLPARQPNEIRAQQTAIDPNQDIMFIPFSITLSSMLNRRLE